MDNAVLIGKGEAQQWLLGKYANRHGLVAGATGTGKTVTLQVLAEGFSDLGVPVFAADIKGDLAGISQAGTTKPKLTERAAKVGLSNYAPQAYPVVFWDVFGEEGHPLRGTISDMGPLLLARLMGLSDVQEAVLQLVFKYCDDNGLLLLDLKDLKSALAYVADNAESLGNDYGLVHKSSVSAIQRSLLTLDADGAEHFFGEPALDLKDLMRQDMTGRGIINVLAADKLYQKPALYATFLLWLLAELFERLPERGDADKPLLVFFFASAVQGRADRWAANTISWSIERRLTRSWPHARRQRLRRRRRRRHPQPLQPSREVLIGRPCSKRSARAWCAASARRSDARSAGNCCAVCWDPCDVKVRR